MFCVVPALPREMIALGVAISLWSTEARAACDARTLADAVARAESAFVNMDEDPFVTASSDAEVTLDCTAEVLSPVEVAGFHRVHALLAFLRGDHARATLEFRAVLGTQPGYQLSTDIAPVGHPLRVDFDASAAFGEGERFPLPSPQRGWLLVDGQRATTAPGGRPFVLQRVDDEGIVADTAWIDVGSPVPRYPTAAPAVSSEESGGRSPVATWVGVGTLALGGGLYGAAFVARGRYEAAVSSGAPRDQVVRTHTTTNVLAGAGTALLAGGAVVTLVGVF